MNEVNLIGFLGGDFEPNYTQMGKCYARNQLAITKRFKNAKGNEESSTTWIPIVIFGKSAETAYLHFSKGSQFACKGELVSNQYTDKHGENRTSLSVIVHKFYWLVGNKKQENKPQEQVKQKDAIKEVQDEQNVDFDKVALSETENPFNAAIEATEAQF